MTNKSNNKIYAHLFLNGSEVVIQYWFFYPFNDWANNHEGDWEHINVIVSDPNPSVAQLKRVDYYFHHKVITCSNPGIDFYVEDGTHPVVFVGGTSGYDIGEGGHGSYPCSGAYVKAGGENDLGFNIPGGITDYPDGNGRYIRYSNCAVERIPSRDRLDYNNPSNRRLSWLNADMLWGMVNAPSPGDWTEPLTGKDVGNDGPHGPAHNSGWNGVGSVGEYATYTENIPYFPVTNSGWGTPQPATNLSASDVPDDAGGKIKLIWSLSSDDPAINGDPTRPHTVKEYHIYRSTTSGSGWTYLNKVSAGRSVYYDATATTGTTFYYTVKSYNGILYPNSNPESSAIAYDNRPSAPTVTSVTSTTNVGINVSWTPQPPDPGATGFMVKCEGPTNKTINVGNVLNYTITGLAKGIYDVSVAGYNQAGTGTYSQKSSIYYNDVQPPAQPTGLTAKVVTYGTKFEQWSEVQLNWNDNTEIDLAGYNIYHKAGDVDWYRLNSSSTVTTASSDYIHTTPSRGTNYYRVKAVDLSGNESPYVEKSVYVSTGYVVRAIDPGNPTPSDGLVRRAGWFKWGENPDSTADYDPEKLIYHFTGLNPDNKYTLGVTYYAPFDSTVELRKQTLDIDDIPIHTPRQIPDKPTLVTNMLPKATYLDGEIYLTFKKISGENVVVSKIILWEFVNGVGNASIREIEDTIPQNFVLFQNHPNPFNPSTSISYTIPNNERVSLKVYNLMGQLVRTLVDENKEAGYYNIEWNGKDEKGIDVPSGIYIYTISAGSFKDMKKMLLMK